jgi:hypothetical protein
MSDTTAWLNDARRTFEGRLIEGQSTETPPTLHVRRAGRLAAILTCTDPRALVLGLSPMAAGGFGADELAFTSDVCGTRSQTNPEGKPWRPHEMQERFREPAVAALVLEALVVVHARRGQPVEMAHQAYRRCPGRLEWDAAPSPVGEPDGPFVRALVAAVNGPSLADLQRDLGLNPKEFGLNEAEGELHRQMGTLRALKFAAEEHGAAIAIAVVVPPEPWAERIVRATMADAGLELEWLRPR